MKNLFLVKALLIFILPAYSGVVITGTGEATVERIYIKDNQIRIDIKEHEQGDAGRILFKSAGDDKLLTVIDEKESAYYKISAEDMGLIKKRMDEFIKSLKAAYEEMPEESRKLFPPEYSALLEIEKMKTSVAREQKDVEFGEWRCDEYVVYGNGSKVSAVLAVKASDFGLSGADFRMLREIDEFIKIPAPGFVIGFMSSVLGNENLVPVRIVEFEDGREDAVSLSVKSISRQDIDISVFEIPNNLSHRELPGLGTP